jgi:Tfp pilus assembly protein PilF
MLDKILHVADNSDVLNNYSNLLCQPSYKYMQQ